MSIVSSNWQMLSPFTLGGALLGVLGTLYLAYDFFGRPQKVLQRCVWVFSSGLLVTLVLMASYLFLFGSERLDTGYSSQEVWRTMLIVSPLGFLIQFAFFSLPPQDRPPVIVWLKLAYSMAFSNILIGLGAVMAPQGSSPVEAVIFALPGTLVIGLLNGFSPTIQWWFLHLPEKRVMAIGALLILCAFALLLVQLLLGFLGLSF